MTTGFWRLVWRSLTSRRHTTPDPPRPGSDEQWLDMPHLLNRFNDSDQADEDDRRWTP